MNGMKAKTWLSPQCGSLKINFKVLMGLACIIPFVSYMLIGQVSRYYQEKTTLLVTTPSSKNEYKTLSTPSPEEANKTYSTPTHKTNSAAARTKEYKTLSTSPPLIRKKWNDPIHRPTPECIGRQRSAKEDETDTYRRPLIIFSEARSGSTLFSSLLDIISEVSDLQDLDMLNLYELFLGNKFPESDTDHLRRISKMFQKECANMDEAFSQKISRELLDLRFQDLRTFFRAMMDTPTSSTNSYFSAKVFSYILDESALSPISTTPKDFIDSILNAYNQTQTNGIGHPHHPLPKFVVLWRRRMIESYFSREAAIQSGGWQNTKTNESSAMVVNKNKLENYIERKVRWFEGVRDALDSFGLEYEVFEYELDLLDEASKKRTVKRLADMMDLYGFGDPDIQSVLNRLGLSKQSQVPIERLVKNWEEVEQWGYGGQVNDWPNLFETNQLKSP